MEEILRKIGLSGAEVKIYLALLKLCKATVSQLAEETGIHRTNIYMEMNKLRTKGFVSFFKEEGKLHFKAASPESLLTYLKETETEVKEIIPSLKKVMSIMPEKTSVEIFRGAKGMKTIMQNMIKEKKEILGYGATGQLRRYLPAYALMWLRDLTHYKIKCRFLYIEGTEIKHPQIKVRCLSKESFSPVAIMAYANKTCITIWEPDLVAILIESKEVANNYKKYFELLWKIAKTPSKK